MVKQGHSETSSLNILKRILSSIILTLLFLVAKGGVVHALNTDSLMVIASKPTVSLQDNIKEQEVKEEAIRVENARLAAIEAERVRMVAVWIAHPAGNNYYGGQCTWFVATKRPVPYGLGNANTWYARAKAWGFPTGTEPRAGAVGQTKYGMHVVYVEAVNPDGTITISEMNYDYVPYHKRTITANPANYYYIY